MNEQCVRQCGEVLPRPQNITFLLFYGLVVLQYVLPQLQVFYKWLRNVMTDEKADMVHEGFTDRIQLSMNAYQRDVAQPGMYSRTLKDYPLKVVIPNDYALQYIAAVKKGGEVYHRQRTRKSNRRNEELERNHQGGFLMDHASNVTKKLRNLFATNTPLERSQPLDEFIMNLQHARYAPIEMFPLIFFNVLTLLLLSLSLATPTEFFLEILSTQLSLTVNENFIHNGLKLLLCGAGVVTAYVAYDLDKHHRIANRQTDLCRKLCTLMVDQIRPSICEHWVGGSILKAHGIPVQEKKYVWALTFKKDPKVNHKLRVLVIPRDDLYQYFGSSETNVEIIMKGAARENMKRRLPIFRELFQYCEIQKHGSEESKKYIKFAVWGTLDLAPSLPCYGE